MFFVRETTSHRRVGLLLLLAGLLLYAVALGAGFVSDDLPLVNAALRSDNVFGLPAEFSVQLLRPITYSTYRLEAMIWGAWAPGFHLTNILLHILASWLLFLFVDVVSGRRAIAFWSALLFLASSVHSEAVTTVFGRTEPVMTCALLGASYAWARFRLNGGWRWMLAAYLLFAAALLSKEPSLLYLGAIVVLEGWLTIRQTARLSVADVRGAVLRLLPFVATAALYLATRQILFGHPLGTYSGFAATPVHMLQNLRWFLLRTLLPGTVRNIPIVVARLDLIAMAIGAVVLLAAARRPRDRGLIVLCALALAITLFPVLPLSISIESTESERFVYLPSVFAAVLTVLAIERVLPRPVWFGAAMSAFVLIHAAALTHQNLKWVAAGQYVRTTIETMGDEIKAHPDIDAVMLMNMADSAHGVFLFRDGFFPAIEMFRPELMQGAPIWPIAAHRIMSFQHPIVVRQTGPRAFRFEVPDGDLVRPVDSTWFYRITQQTSRMFDLEFTDVTRKWLVLYAAGGVTRRAAVIDGPGVPFGNVLTPELSCDGASATVTGWALDSDGVENVVIEAAPGDAATGSWTARADAVWQPGNTHPLIPKRLRVYPGSDRAGWSAQVPCQTASDAVRQTTLRAMAIDRTGARGELGQVTLTRRAP